MTRLLAAFRSTLSALRKALAVPVASPASIAARAFLTAPLTWVRASRLRALRRIDCRARLRADLCVATGILRAGIGAGT
jgi:hypothetical protein